MSSLVLPIQLTGYWKPLPCFPEGSAMFAGSPLHRSWLFPDLRVYSHCCPQDEEQPQGRGLCGFCSGASGMPCAWCSQRVLVDFLWSTVIGNCICSPPSGFFSASGLSSSCQSQRPHFGARGFYSCILHHWGGRGLLTALLSCAEVTAAAGQPCAVFP